MISTLQRKTLINVIIIQFEIKETYNKTKRPIRGFIKLSKNPLELFIKMSILPVY